MAAAAGETAHRFGRDIGADLAMTIDGFGNRVARRRLIVGAKDAVFVDEAGLLEDGRWLTLLRAADRAGVTVTGDTAQLSPIEAGGLFRVMTRHLGSAELTENFRARDAWAKDAWAELRVGRALPAVARLERKRRIVISGTRTTSRARAVEQWDEDRRARCRPRTWPRPVPPAHRQQQHRRGPAQRRRPGPASPGR